MSTRTYVTVWNAVGDGTPYPEGRLCWAWDREYERAVLAMWFNGSWRQWSTNRELLRVTHWTPIQIPSAPGDPS